MKVNLEEQIRKKVGLMNKCLCQNPVYVMLRKNDVVEYRILNISNDINQVGNVDFEGNWKIQSKTAVKVIGVKCNGCETMIVTSKDIKEATEDGRYFEKQYIKMRIELDKNRRIDMIDVKKGVLLTNKDSERFF